jgi:hypothetical protein
MRLGHYLCFSVSLGSRPRGADWASDAGGPSCVTETWDISDRAQWCGAPFPRLPHSGPVLPEIGNGKGPAQQRSQLRLDGF